MVDYPDGTLPITVSVYAELLSQFRNLPWWVRYAPQKILYLDDFEGTFKWEQEAGTVEKSSAFGAFEGNSCMKMTTPTTASVEATSMIHLGGVPRSKMALQFHWSVDKLVDVEQFGWFGLGLGYHGGGYSDTIDLRYLHFLDGVEQKKWQYLNEDSEWTDIPGASEYLEVDYLYHQFLMLVFDLRDKPHFSRLVTSGLDLDISSLLPIPQLESDLSHIELTFWAVPDTDNAISVNIDALCLSHEEQ